MNIQAEFEFVCGRMIFDSYASSIQFPIIISITVAHIQLKFIEFMYLMNIKVKFEIGFGPIIFDRGLSLEL